MYSCCAVAKSRLNLCDSMDCTTSGFPVCHYLLESWERRKVLKESWALNWEYTTKLQSSKLYGTGTKTDKFPGVGSNSCPLSQWCYPSIPSSVTPFYSHPQCFTKSETFPISLVLTSGGRSTGVSVSASFLPMSIQGWFPLVLTGLISLQ